MKALVYHGPDQRSWDSVDDPGIIDPGDAIVRIDSSTICGTDLHILKGDVPEVDAGHGARPRGRRHDRGGRPRRQHVRRGRPRAGLVHQLLRALPLLQGGPLRPVPGRRRLDLRPPDRRAAGRVRARAVRRQLGAQGARGAERRAGAVPRRHPADLLRGRRPQRRRCSRATSSRSSARARSGSPRSSRRSCSRRATSSRSTSTTAASRRPAVRRGRDDQQRHAGRRRRGDGAHRRPRRGRDASRRSACRRPSSSPSSSSGPGGHVANVGVHGKPATLHLEKLWIRDVTMTTGLVDTFSTPQLLKLVASGRLDPTVFATHRFALGDTMEAYDVFADAARTGALKVVLEGARADGRRVGDGGRGRRRGLIRTRGSGGPRGSPDPCRRRKRGRRGRSPMACGWVAVSLSIVPPSLKEHAS